MGIEILGLIFGDLEISIILLLLGALLAVSLGESKYRIAISGSSIVLLIAALAVIILKPFNAGVLNFDEFTRFFAVIFLFTSILIITAMHKELSDVPRYGLSVMLILIANIGMIIAASSLNIVYIILGWELAGLSTYALVASRRTDPLSIEAAMKFFIVGVIGFGLSLLGISFLFGALGTLDLDQMAQLLTNGEFNVRLLYTGIALLIAGMGFKMAIVPFHVWIPDTYEGAPNTITSFLAAASKTMAFAVALRIFYRGLAPVSYIWVPIFAILALITMTYANLAALAQTKMKRLLAWSSIAHAGYIILLFGAFGESVRLIAGGLFHILMHALMKILAFIAAIYITTVIGSDLIEEYAGLGRSQKFVAFALTVDLLAMAGIPPLAGFWSKYLLFMGVVDTGYAWLALAAVINSAISLYYYARVIKIMYFDVGKAAELKMTGPRIYYIAIVITFLIIMLAGIYPDPIIDYLESISP